MVPLREIAGVEVLADTGWMDTIPGPRERLPRGVTRYERILWLIRDLTAPEVDVARQAIRFQGEVEIRPVPPGYVDPHGRAVEQTERAVLFRTLVDSSD